MENYPGEQWKEVRFDFEFTNQCRLEVSNFGRLRTFNKLKNGSIVNGSTVNGYRIIRLKLYKPRDAQVAERLNYLQQQVYMLAKKLRTLQKDGAPAATIKETEALLTGLRKNLTEKFRKDVRKRTINYHALFHRLVADYFLNKPEPGQTVVAHINFDKMNNRAHNLQWMTPEVNYEHQKKSPHVIREKAGRVYQRKEESRATKLTITKVMLLKKLLNQGKPMKQLVKQFKITDTQIFRIKRGENWKEIKAAT